MKKQVLLATAIATVMAFGAHSAIAQNVAIVNGKAKRHHGGNGGCQ